MSLAKDSIHCSFNLLRHFWLRTAVGKHLYQRLHFCSQRNRFSIYWQENWLLSGMSSVVFNLLFPWFLFNRAVSNLRVLEITGWSGIILILTFIARFGNFCFQYAFFQIQKYCYSEADTFAAIRFSSRSFINNLDLLHTFIYGSHCIGTWGSEKITWLL